MLCWRVIEIKSFRNEKAQINWALIVCPWGEVNMLLTNLLTIPMASD